MVSAAHAFAQTPAEKPQEKPAPASPEKTAEPANPAQFELLETKYRFETNGDSRKEVHALVKINSELGVRQFARLNFDYNRSFQSVEIPQVHIAHANGGTADILASAITDAANPAVEKFPAYQDVRVKSVRILGLQPGDSLEYRVITATKNSPIAPDFWLSHSFDRSGVVEAEDFILDLPASVPVRINPQTPADPMEKSGEGDSARGVLRWHRVQKPDSPVAQEDADGRADIALSTLNDLGQLADRLSKVLYPRETPGAPIRSKADEFFQENKDPNRRLRAIYDFVSKRIATVDLPLGSTGFHARHPEEILQSGYATQEDKATLFAALARAITVEPYLYFTFPEGDEAAASLPARFDHILVGVILQRGVITALDPALEVAPFGVISAKLRGRAAFCATEMNVPGSLVVELLPILPKELPFPASQRVETVSTLSAAGILSSKVKYALRGDNELLLRVTFHQTPPEKQKEIAQYLALSDGFRGKVTRVKTSDPYDTEKPFEVEYELTQEKFVDWSKKPVRIPALLPLPGLPEVPKKSAVAGKIELGPPLDVELSGTLRLPPGTTAQAPPGTSVKRDYATFASQYSSKLNVLRFSRHLNFVAPELSSDRAVDLNAFLHAVQSDQALLFELDKPASVPAPK
ncbi:MAG TPA: DUF3857 and transglutaminase domain-containing protein [Candidatus Acidoferrum sp.]|nr:DUF3857 and transglutaminase domain-containing protein [Candidatus Acidoferrum sp.]